MQMSLQDLYYNLRRREQRSNESFDETLQRRSARNEADRLRRARKLGEKFKVIRNKAMGDADGEVVVHIPVQEIEAWMDEALGVVDEGFDNLIALVTNLNERTKSILLKLKIFESFRNIFIALNFFIVPVVIAIMLCYGTSEAVRSDTRGIEAGLQTLVMLLMFMSSTVGLPLYIFYVWESYKMYENMNEDPNKQSLANESQDSSHLFDDSLLTLLTYESSMERLNEFARLLNDRMPRRMRADLQRRRSTESEPSNQITQHGMEDSSEMEMEDTSASVEPSEEKQDQYLDSAEEKPTATEFPILYQFQVLMNAQSPDLAVRLEAAKRGQRKETTENEEMVEQNNKL